MSNIWTFKPVYPDEYTTATDRVVVIGPEPNGGNACPNPKDMGQWFREAPNKNFWGNAKFFRGTLFQVLGVLNLAKGVKPDTLGEDHVDVWQRVRYLDLKQTEGGSTVLSTSSIRLAASARLDEIVSTLASDCPSAIIVQGRHAQRAFESIVVPALREQAPDLRRVGLPHPSNAGYAEKLVRESYRYLRPLNDSLARYNRSKWV